MDQGARKPDVDERMVKLLVGLIAIALPILVGWIAWPEKLGSISAAYWSPPWPQTLFIGFLFAIAGFLLAYDGRSTPERVASRIAAIAARSRRAGGPGCDRPSIARASTRRVFVSTTGCRSP